MGRELRKVPANWEHPKNDDGTYHPMHDKYYGDVVNDWIKQHNEWSMGMHIDLVDNRTTKEEYPFYAQWAGGPPDVEYYQTKKYKPEELTHIQLYQTTSEGTPVSPVFKADEFDKLCEYAAENCTTFADFKASKEEWKEMLNNNLVCHRQGNMMFM